MSVVEVFGIRASKDSTFLLDFNDSPTVLVQGGGTDDAVGGLGGDNVGDITDAFVLEVEVAEVGLACVDQDAEELKDSLVALTLGESTHRGFHEVELLLQIVEADLGVKTVPVEHSVVNEG